MHKPIFQDLDSMPFAALTVGQVKELLLDISRPQTIIQKATHDHLSVDEVAELTGYTKASIYKFIHHRQIPFHKPAHGGRKITFARKDVTEWLQARRVETMQEYCDAQEIALSNSTKR